MKEPENREIMSRLYRLIEKYEEPPSGLFADDAAKYFAEVIADSCKLCSDFGRNEFSAEFAVAFATAIEKRFKRVNEFPLKDKPREPEQLTMI